MTTPDNATNTLKVRINPRNTSFPASLVVWAWICSLTTSNYVYFVPYTFTDVGFNPFVDEKGGLTDILTRSNLVGYSLSR